MAGLFTATATLIIFLIKIITTLITAAFFLASLPILTRTIPNLRAFSNVLDEGITEVWFCFMGCFFASLGDLFLYIPLALVQIITLVRLPAFPTSSWFSSSSSDTFFYSTTPRAMLAANALAGVLFWLMLVPSTLISLFAPWRWGLLKVALVDFFKEMDGNAVNVEAEEFLAAPFLALRTAFFTVVDYLLGIPAILIALCSPWRWQRLAREWNNISSLSGDDPTDAIVFFIVVILMGLLDLSLLLPMLACLLTGFGIRIFLAAKTFAARAAALPPDSFMDPVDFAALMWSHGAQVPGDILSVLALLFALLFPHRYAHIWRDLKTLWAKLSRDATTTVNSFMYLFAFKTISVLLADAFVALPALCILPTHHSYLAYKEYSRKTQQLQDDQDDQDDQQDQEPGARADSNNVQHIRFAASPSSDDDDEGPCSTSIGDPYSYLPHKLILKHFFILIAEILFILPLILLLICTIYRMVLCIISIRRLRAAAGPQGLPQFTIHKQIGLHAALAAVEIFVLPPMMLPLVLTGYRLRFLRDGYDPDKLGAVIMAIGTQFVALVADIPFALMMLLGLLISFYRIPVTISAIRAVFAIPHDAPLRSARMKATFRRLAIETLYSTLKDLASLPFLLLSILTLYRFPILIKDLLAAKRSRAQFRSQLETTPRSIPFQDLCFAQGMVSTDTTTATQQTVPIVVTELDMFETFQITTEDNNNNAFQPEYVPGAMSLLAWHFFIQGVLVLEELACLFLVLIMAVLPWRMYQAVALLSLDPSDEWMVDVIKTWKLDWQSTWARVWHSSALRKDISASYFHQMTISEAWEDSGRLRSPSVDFSYVTGGRDRTSVPVNVELRLRSMGDATGAELAAKLRESHSLAWHAADLLYEAKAFARPEYNLPSALGSVLCAASSAGGATTSSQDPMAVRTAYEDAMVTKMQAAMSGVADASLAFNKHMNGHIKYVSSQCCVGVPTAMFHRTREQPGGNLWYVLLTLGDAFLDIVAIIGALFLLVTLVRFIPLLGEIRVRLRYGVAPRMAVAHQVLELGKDILTLIGFCICLGSVIQTYGIIFTTWDIIRFDDTPIDSLREAVLLHLLFIVHPIGWIYGMFWTIFGTAWTYVALLAGALWGPLAPMELLSKFIPGDNDEFNLACGCMLGTALYAVPLIGLYNVMGTTNLEEANEKYLLFLFLAMAGIGLVLVTAILFAIVRERQRENVFRSRPEWLLVANIPNVVAVLSVIFELLQIITLAGLVWDPAGGVWEWAGLGFVRLFIPLGSKGGFFFALTIVGLFYLFTSAALVAELIIHTVDEGAITDSVAWRVGLTIMSGPGFVYVVFSLLLEVACVWNPHASRLVLGYDQDVVCFRSPHTARAAVALIALSFFVPLASLLSTHFGDEGAPRLTFQYRSSYTLGFVLVKLGVLMAFAFGLWSNPSLSAALSALLLALFALVSTVYGMRGVPASLPRAHVVRTGGIWITSLIMGLASVGASSSSPSGAILVLGAAVGVGVVAGAVWVVLRRMDARARADAALASIERVRECCRAVGALERRAAAKGVLHPDWRANRRKMVHRLLQQAKEDGDWQLLQRILLVVENNMFSYYDGPHLEERWSAPGLPPIRDAIQQTYHRYESSAVGLRAMDPCYSGEVTTIRREEWRSMIREPGNQRTARAGEYAEIGMTEREADRFLAHLAGISEWTEHARTPASDVYFGLHGVEGVPVQAGTTATWYMVSSAGGRTLVEAEVPESIQAHGGGGVCVAAPGAVVVPIVPHPDSPPFVSLDVAVRARPQSHHSRHEIQVSILIGVTGMVNSAWVEREWRVDNVQLILDPSTGLAVDLFVEPTPQDAQDQDDDLQSEDDVGWFKQGLAGFGRLVGGWGSRADEEKPRIPRDDVSQDGWGEEEEEEEEEEEAGSSTESSSTATSYSDSSDGYFYSSCGPEIDAASPDATCDVESDGGLGGLGGGLGGLGGGGGDVLPPSFGDVMMGDAGLRTAGPGGRMGGEGDDWFSTIVDVDDPGFDNNMMFVRVEIQGVSFAADVYVGVH